MTSVKDNLCLAEAAAAAAALPDEHDVQFLSDGYDLLLKSNTAMGDYLDNFARKLDSLQRNIDKIGKAVDEILHYSYPRWKNMNLHQTPLTYV